jgi:hypothetical protein
VGAGTICSVPLEEADGGEATGVMAAGGGESIVTSSTSVPSTL